MLCAVMLQICTLQFHTDSTNSQRLTNNPMTRSCIWVDREQQIVLQRFELQKHLILPPATDIQLTPCLSGDQSHATANAARASSQHRITSHRLPLPQPPGSS